MSTNAWKNRFNKDPAYEIKRAIAKDAYFANAWIYNVNSDKWYSPEEFMEANDSISIHRGDDNSKKFKIRDPKGGILEKSKRVTEAQAQLNDFIERVDRYFELKAIRKDR